MACRARRNTVLVANERMPRILFKNAQTNLQEQADSGQYIHKGGLRGCLPRERDDCSDHGYSCESNYAN